MPSYFLASCLFKKRFLWRIWMPFCIFENNSYHYVLYYAFYKVKFHFSCFFLHPMLKSNTKAASLKNVMYSRRGFSSLISPSEPKFRCRFNCLDFLKRESYGRDKNLYFHKINLQSSGVFLIPHCWLLVPQGLA